MNWSQLFSSRRTGDAPDKAPNPDPHRTSYIRDYDRLIFSSAFRRLQNKTQVFPLPGAVFVHNRLTHSLEVASVGRSLGRMVGEAIAEKHFSVAQDKGSDGTPLKGEPEEVFYRHELQNVIAAACLAHDIGNPPFGHSGEDAIRTFFEEMEGDVRTKIEDALSPAQLLDFQKFEGNSNAFRTLTHRFGENAEGGYKLTYATLASIVKYPCSSEAGFQKGKLSTKKSGFFTGERETFSAIAQAFDIPQTEGGDGVTAEAWARHPFVFLTEAADDLCYRVIDMEDAHRLRIVSTEEFLDLFLPFFPAGEGFGTAGYVRKKVAALRDEGQKVSFVRASWIGLMVGKLAQAFLEREEALLAGTLERDLLSCLPPHEAALIDRINTVSVERIYNHRSVVEVEVAGYHVIGGLLREFIPAVLYPKKAKSFKTLQLIPSQFPVQGHSVYEDVQGAVDFIAGMTDLFAVDLWRKMTGIAGVR